MRRQNRPPLPLPTFLNDDTRIVVEARVPAVYYTCPVTFETFSWLEVGDTQEMTFKQLRIMNTKYPRYFTEKWLLPNDGTVMKKLHLDKIYATKVNRADMKRFCGDDIKDVEDIFQIYSGEFCRNHIHRILRCDAPQIDKLHPMRDAQA